MKPLRQENIIAQIENATNFEYCIGDGDSIGGSLGDLENPIYIEPTENGYVLQDMNDTSDTDAIMHINWEDEAAVKAYYDSLPEVIEYPTIEALIDAINELEESYK